MSTSSRVEKLRDELEESVYNNPEERRREGPSRYRSRFHNKVRVDMWCQKKGCNSTMGTPRASCPPPKHYLKKHSRNHPVFFGPKGRAGVNKDVEATAGRGNSQERRSRLGLEPPSSTECSSDRDFLEENALNVIKMAPRRHTRCYLGEDGIHRVDLSEGPFVLRPGFGEVPEYIRQRQHELYWEGQLWRNQKLPPGCRYMGEDERAWLIKGLRDRWAELNGEYSRLPVHSGHWVTEAKERLIPQLKQIERDLALLTKDGPIMVKYGSQHGCP